MMLCISMNNVTSLVNCYSQAEPENGINDVSNTSDPTYILK